MNKIGEYPYLLGGNHDTDFLDCLGELIGLDSAVVVEVEVLEGSHKHSLFRRVAGSLLAELLNQLFLKATQLNFG
jgi:hypothetical protein